MKRKRKTVRKGTGYLRRLVHLATETCTERHEQLSKDELRSRLTNRKKHCVFSRQKLRGMGQVDWRMKLSGKNNFYDYYPIHLETSELNSSREKLSRSTHRLLFIQMVRQILDKIILVLKSSDCPVPPLERAMSPHSSLLFDHRMNGNYGDQIVYRVTG